MRVDFPARPYQEEALDKWVSAIAAGQSRGVVTLPTGCGKTLLGLMACAHVGRTLWLTHRNELVEQPYETAKAALSGCDVGVVKAARNESRARDLVIASIQTLSRQSRFESFIAEQDRSHPIRQIVVDECHHSAAASWLRVLDHPYFASTPCLGLTATPERSDGKGLAKVWGARPLYRMTLRQAIDQGWLVPYAVDRIYCGLDLSLVEIGGDGDFDSDSLEKEMVRSETAKAVAKAVGEALSREKRKTIVFTVSVNQAQRITAELKAIGHASECVWGDMGDFERRSALAAHKRGDTNVLVNCSLLSEGYDDPSISCVVVAKPTKSAPLYRQCVGRGFRLYPGKEDCLILDLVGADGAHGAVTADMLDDDEDDEEFGKSKKKKKRGEVEMHGKDGEFALVAGMNRASAYGIQSSRQKRRARVQWLPITANVFAVSAGEHGSLLMVREGGEDTWRGYRLPADAWGADEVIPIMRRPAPQELACGVIEDRARKLGVFGLSSSTARWRKAEPSERQVEMFKKLHPGSDVPLTKGEASDAISLTKLRRLFETTGTIKL